MWVTNNGYLPVEKDGVEGGLPTLFTFEKIEIIVNYKLVNRN